MTGKGAELSEQEKLQSLIDVDLKGTINCCWGVVPVMDQAGHGVIINMTWDLAIHPRTESRERSSRCTRLYVGITTETEAISESLING